MLSGVHSWARAALEEAAFVSSEDAQPLCCVPGPGEAAGRGGGAFTGGNANGSLLSREWEALGSLVKGRTQRVALIRRPRGSLCRLAVCLPRFARAVLGVCRINRWAKLERIETWIFSWWAFSGQTHSILQTGTPNAHGFRGMIIRACWTKIYTLDGNTVALAPQL